MGDAQGFHLTRIGSMAALVVAELLLVAACSDSLGSLPADRGLSPGIVESVERVELGSPIQASRDADKEEPDQRFGNQIVVRLDDGRTVILVYTGVRRFQAGQRVRVHVSDRAAFVL